MKFCGKRYFEQNGGGGVTGGACRSFAEVKAIGRLHAQSSLEVEG